MDSPNAQRPQADLGGEIGLGSNAIPPLYLRLSTSPAHAARYARPHLP